MYTPQDNVEQPLYVVTSIFNPVRFKSRWKLYRDFQRHVRDSGAILITIEAAFGERTFALDRHANPLDTDFAPAHRQGWQSHGPAAVPDRGRMPNSRKDQDYLKVRVGSQQEIWLKENLNNLATMHLPEDAKYVAFIDADVQFTRPDWVSETLHALQHYHVVQMFSSAINLSHEYEPMEVNRGFAYSHLHDLPRPEPGNYYYYPTSGAGGAWHPGFAWAWRRSALNDVGGLIEHAILGAGDDHMARALIGRAAESLNPQLSKGYKNRVLTWERRATDHIKGNIGYIDGTINHQWHGRITHRRYLDRWRLLIKHHFDPDVDLKKDARGVIQLTDKKPSLRDDIRRYFRSRSEDSINAPDDDFKLVGAKPLWP